MGFPKFRLYRSKRTARSQVSKSLSFPAASVGGCQLSSSPILPDGQGLLKAGSAIGSELISAKLADPGLLGNSQVILPYRLQDIGTIQLMIEARGRALENPICYCQSFMQSIQRVISIASA